MKSWSRTERSIWILGLLLTISVGFFNHGIIALDDYTEGFARFIPAQSLSFKETVETSGIRLPFQSVFLLSLSKLALLIGLTEPTEQLRFVLVLLGIFVFCAHSLASVHFFRGSKERLLILGLVSFYFILPLMFTRPLIENMSGAFITLAAYCAFQFHQTQKDPWIAYSVLMLSVASLFRFQTGICLLALPILIFFNKGKYSWVVFWISCFLSFLLTGLLDLTLTGGFHRSLRAYVEYNIHFSSSYGVTPFYTFLLLFIGLSIPPTFFGRYTGFNWKHNYRPLLAPLLFFLFFLLAHSLIPHKEERFIIPIIVVFLILLVPLACFWVFEKKSVWRTLYFTAINFSLLVLISFSPPQKNVIHLVRYLDKNPQIKKVLNYDNSVVLFPTAFSLRKTELIPMRPFIALAALTLSCDTVLAVREELYQTHFASDGFQIREKFTPGFVEGLLVKLNPRQNGRRGTLYLLKDRNCD